MLVVTANAQAKSGGMEKRNGVFDCMPEAYTTAPLLDTAIAALARYAGAPGTGAFS